MDKIKKLFRKIPKKDRLLLEKALLELYTNKIENLQIQRLKGYENIYRIRVGNYRIIFYKNDKKIILKAIKQRNEATYKDF